jgi:uncharacterized protein
VRLENTFEVDAPPERAWELLMDVPRVIPCMPGTELTETVDASSWKARMTVKLGPMSFAFATDVRRDEVDEAGRRARLTARAREVRGRGGGQAAIESTLFPAGQGTRIQLVTDLSLSGALAQFGGGMVEDVAGQLTRRFADCLRAQLASGGDGAAAPGRESSPPAEPAQPVAGLPLVFGALRRAVTRIARRS